MIRNFIIIGMDDNREPFFPPEVLRHIRKGKVFSGGLRHREIVEKLLPEGAEWISITVPLDNVFAQYENIFADFEKKASDASIVVFASGDPLFFGFANTVKRKLPDAKIRLYPAFNSLQTLAHRLVMPYDDNILTKSKQSFPLPKIKKDFTLSSFLSAMIKSARWIPTCRMLTTS